MSKANLIIQHHPSWTWWRDLSAPLRSLASYDAAVIATSPDLHIEQAKRCLDVGISRVLIEKPLCGFGQLERGRGLPPDRVVVAYNYRYHPVLESAGWLPYRVNWDRWQMEAVQYRPSLPEWGLLLDHVSHDFDIVRMLAGELRITGARHYKDEVQDHWAIEGELGDGGRVSIYETVRYSRATTREVVILNPKGEVISIEPDKSMYSRMWRYFLDRQSVRTFTSLSDAIAVQALLEECARYDQNT